MTIRQQCDADMKDIVIYQLSYRDIYGLAVFNLYLDGEWLPNTNKCCESILNEIHFVYLNFHSSARFELPWEE